VRVRGQVRLYRYAFQLHLFAPHRCFSTLLFDDDSVVQFSAEETAALRSRFDIPDAMNKKRFAAPCIVRSDHGLLSFFFPLIKSLFYFILF